MSQNQNDRIAPANIIALVGIAGIGVISGIGSLLNTDDGSVTWPIIWAVIVMTVLGAFLCIAIKAKGEDSHRELWTPVMWGSIAIYVIAAALMCGPFLKFFYVVAEKDNLQEQAKAEIANMESIFKRYEEQRKDFLSRAETQFTAFQLNGKNGSNDLKNYFNDRVGNNIRTWMEDIAIPATNISSLKKSEEWSMIKKEVNGWNYLNLPKLALRIKMLQEDSWTELNNRIERFGSEQALIPVIKGGQGTPYYLDGCAQFELGEAPVSIFCDKLSQDDNVTTTLGFIVYILLNLLVLFNILVAPTSKLVGPEYRGKETEGTTL
ncbi:MAG: hypothetical protein II200_05720 [Bacteroidaceae bacterium]|nr:hypothetical protein [Bacteroidaceae bacterium]